MFFCGHSLVGKSLLYYEPICLQASFCSTESVPTTNLYSSRATRAVQPFYPAGENTIQHFNMILCDVWNDIQERNWHSGCIMLYHVVSCCIMLHHIVSCCIMVYHVVSCSSLFSVTEWILLTVLKYARFRSNKTALRLVGCHRLIDIDWRSKLLPQVCSKNLLEPWEKKTHETMGIWWDEQEQHRSCVQQL